MTHGCLRVIANRRSMMLHTYHTGMDIPLLPPLVFDVVANYYRFVKREDSTLERLIGNFVNHAAMERLEHTHSASALLIAAKPMFLEPTSPGVKRDLPSWSGIDLPYVLRIGGGRWRLFDEDGTLLNDYDYFREVAERILQLPVEDF